MPLKHMLVRELPVRPDGRGFFCELFRADQTELFPEPVVQVNMSQSYPGVVRAWHRHARGQIDFFVVLQGSLRVCAFDPVSRNLEEVVVSDWKLSVVRVPGHLYHGTMAVGNNTALTVYGTTRLYEYSNPDEERLPWDSVAVVPLSVNGSTSDPRAGAPWDWLRPPHR